MAVTKREYIFVTFLVSCISVGFLLGAIGSQNWVTGDVTLISGSITVNYGLFQGVAVKQILVTPETNTLHLTCNYRENVCLYSCKTNKEARQSQITSILNGCSASTVCNANPDTCNGNTTSEDLKWFNAGVYLSNLVFLCISILLASLSSLIAVYNTARIPAEPFVGIFGLYIWNAAAIVTNLMVLLLWGIHYETNIKESLGYTDTMIPSTNIRIESNVGLSFWFIIASLLCHMIIPGLLYLRQWLIDREPPPPTITIDKDMDNTIFLY